MKIIGYGSTDEEQKLVQKRIDAILNYMTKKQGIPKDRLKRVVDDSAYTNGIEFVFDYF